MKTIKDNYIEMFKKIGFSNQQIDRLLGLRKLKR